MPEKKDATIESHFSSLTDPRQRGKVRHKLTDIMILVICAVISGCDDWTEIELYGRKKEAWLRTFLELPNGLPSHDTISRVFEMISPVELENCFLSWVNGVFEKTNGQIVAIDGKTLRRSHDRSSNKAAIHMVSAWASENGITLGQVETDQKSNEITAIPQLLDLLEINGCIVTIDAMGCQKMISDKIIDNGADYVLAVKGNQGNLYEDIKLFFEDAQNSNFLDISHQYYEEVDGGHGRVDIRRYWTVADIDWLEEKDKWKGLNIIGMAQTETHTGEKITLENRYFISSIANDAEKFGNAVRDHWTIENSCHWTLDIAFREDDCRKRKGHSAANFSRIRRMALNLLKNDTTIKRGVKAKRKAAGWDNDYLVSLLSG
jgi:predicted transposase YbfD/YdcC